MQTVYEFTNSVEKHSNIPFFNEICKADKDTDSIEKAPNGNFSKNHFSKG